MSKPSRRESRLNRHLAVPESSRSSGSTIFFTLVVFVAALFIIWDEFASFEYVGTAYSISTTNERILISATLQYTEENGVFVLPFTQRDLNRLVSFRTETTTPTNLPGHRTGNLDPPPILRFRARPPYPWTDGNTYAVRKFDVIR